MSPTVWILIFTTSCALALKNAPHRASLRSAFNDIARKQNEFEINSPNFAGNLRAFKHHGEPSLDRQRDGFDQLNEEELLDDLVQENGQEETIGDGFQHLVRRYQLQDDGPSSNFRERERSRSHRYMNDQREDIMKELLETLGLEEQMSDNENYGIPREIPEDPRYEYELSPGDAFKPKLFNDRNRDENWDDYYNQDQEYYPALLPPVERRNVNGRYPLGRDFRNYRDLVKRFPVAKRSPKPMTKKRQVTDPEVAQDLASLFGSQHSENQNNVHQTTAGEQNHTFNHEDHTTAAPISTITPKNPKEKEPTQSLKSEEHVIDVRKKSFDWSQYFGIDRRKKKAVLAARPGSQNQDDAFFLQRYYSTMGENLQPPKRNSEKELEEKINKLQQIDSRLKSMIDLVVQEAVFEGSQDMDNSEETKEEIRNKLLTAYSLEKVRQALRDFRNSIIIQQQENQFPDNYQRSIDIDKIEAKHAGREVAEGNRH